MINDVDFLHFVGNQESQFIAPLSDFTESIHEIFEQGDEHYGSSLPWKKTEDKFRIRSNEITVWAGINGHGKSSVLSHVMAHFLKDEKCLVASLEMPIQKTGLRIIRQIAGNASPPKPFINNIIQWCDGRFWVYDQLDTVDPERIIGMCVYAFTELKMDHVIVDSLMKCGIPNKDTEKIQTFVDRLCWVAKSYGGHIHLVHHIRKGETEDTIPNKFDIKGAGEITDLVDNVVIVWKNKKKERRIQAGEDVDKLDVDGLLVVEKQRHGTGWEGNFGLWMDSPSQQFKGSPDARLEWFAIDAK